ncbi:beta-galactosidase-like isoform X2 [Macrosteles quadrilineatus]|nr:beta-galactosidase-like isoform X2 [Macrosteles quadrilineatus]XP_054271092.1 beta-galactosidase-like isoform X2 [Macrosteles quadrilineatus]
MLVILRPGPYICAERDFGGYPPWLLHENPEMGLRTNESSHTHYVYTWLSQLMPRIQPLLYGNGGPVIMVQVENEYGSYWACDHSYTAWLRDVFRSYIGDKAVLFTTDGNDSGYLKCGPIRGVFITVDFGTVGNVTKAFEDLRKIQPHGPLVNSEFYPGWLTHWGDMEAGGSIESVVNTTRQLLYSNASFNFYMFHGGTNFGFTSGANNPPYSPQITSYDYDAPISESGNLTEKYYAIKAVLAEFTQTLDLHVDDNPPFNYGVVKLDPKTSLFNSAAGIPFGYFDKPQTLESLELYSGFMLYEASLPPTKLRLLQIGRIHDRTYVYVDKVLKGVLRRTEGISSMYISNTGTLLSLLVENQGHINYSNMTDLKGILGNVTLNGSPLGPWRHTGYPMTNVSSIPGLPTSTNVQLPAFYSGTFQLPNSGQPPSDTFVDMTGWGKGVLYVNDINLGRYWPSLGPQITLYLPAPYLRQDNVFVILELEKEHPNRTISLVDKPVLNKTQSVTDSDTMKISVVYV